MTESEAAWASWDRAPGDPKVCARLETACTEAALSAGQTVTQFRETYVAARRASLGTVVADIELPSKKEPIKASTRVRAHSSRQFCRGLWQPEVGEPQPCGLTARCDDHPECRIGDPTLCWAHNRAAS